MTGPIRIIQLKRQKSNVITGELVYENAVHYFLKSTDSGDTLKIKKGNIKAIYSLDKLYSIIADLDSKKYVELAKMVKKRGACIGSSKVVFEVMDEMGLL